MKAILLGSGGGLPTKRRSTCSVLVCSQRHGLLIDAGTGAMHVVTRPSLTAALDRLTILLTHFHLDHIIGLTYLSALPSRMRLSLYAPGEALHGQTAIDLLSRVFTTPFVAPGSDLAAIGIDIHDISAGLLDLPGFDVTARVQRMHSTPTLAFRVGDSFAYCTDTASDPGNVDFANGCKTLLHDAWYTADAPRGVGFHSSAADAASIAASAQVANLVLIHISPFSDDASLDREARGVFTHSVVGEDLMAFAC